MSAKVLPVILGTDMNAYGMARAFHEAYGIKSLLIGQGQLLFTKNSKIVEIKIVENLLNSERFAEQIKDVVEAYRNKYEHFIIIASSDNYAEKIIEYKDALAKDFIVPFVDKELSVQLNSKEKFYEICEKYNLDYPMTKIIRKEDCGSLEAIEAIADAIEYDYPVVLKASDSMSYFESQFEGKKKAYILDTREEVIDTLQKVYGSTYVAPMILQEYIDGDDTNMRVVNCVSGPDGKVTLMSVGQPLLEDCTPTLIGNYVAIINTYEEEIFKQIKNFLESINYIGFSNFDLKYDRKTGKFKVFEMNLRQGRSSYFVTGSGYNQAKFLVDAFVLKTGEETVYANKEHLWLSVPQEVVEKYIENEELKQKAVKLIREKKFSKTLCYDKDFSILRNMRVNKYYKGYIARYAQYFVPKNK